MRKLTEHITARLLALLTAFSILLPGAIFTDHIEADIANSDNSVIDSAWSEAGFMDLSNIVDYKDYLLKNSDSAKTSDVIIVEAASYSKDNTSPKIELRENYDGDVGISAVLPSEGNVSYSVNVAEAGYYNIKLLYNTNLGSGSPAVRDIYIDGVIPFSQAVNVVFESNWVNQDGNEMRKDSAGNQIRSKQVQKPIWTTKPVMDSLGYYPKPLGFYLTKGNHTIMFSPQSESLILRSFTLYHEPETPSYEQVISEYRKTGYKSVSKEVNIVIEAEDAKAKSDQTMYSLTDRSSPTVSPYSYSLIRYNTIGGMQWQTLGQWIEWEIKIPESGLYNIGMHFKQALKINDVSIRELYIDGKLPFAEASDLLFDNSNAWQNKLLSGDKGEAYQIYFEKGTHVIRLKASLGRYTSALFKAKSYLSELNSIYRKIIVITGVKPDPYRDYQFDKSIPDTIVDMAKVSEKLKLLEAEIKKLNKVKGNSTPNLQKLYFQLDEMVKSPDKISVRLSAYKDAISSYGTWMESLLKQPLELDKILILPVGTPLPKGDAGFFSMFGHYFMQFLYSFISDYSSVGVLNTSTKANIRVWTFTGRDQSQILKQMINDDFTVRSGIAVDLQLVTSAALMPAIISGKAPDVTMGLGQAEPVNMNLRNAVYNMASFPDYKSVITRFNDQSLIPFTYKTGVYALPDTLSYSMLFYRADMLKELKIPLKWLETWDLLLGKALPEMQLQSLSFGMPAGIGSFLMMQYQKGGDLYLNEGRNSALNTPESIDTMEQYSTLYTQYGMPLSFDFANRFRTGEMPVAIGDFTLYNQLTVFAPEINGMWGMLPVPGTLKADGSIDHTTLATVTGSVILSGTKNPSASWEFLKWWTATDTQSEYGSNLESVIGAAARYNSANIEVMKGVQWNRLIKKNLLKQLESTKAYPEVPGGYITTRYYDFAFRDIVYKNANIRQTLRDAVYQIDSEIKDKRNEYSLDD